MGGEEKLQKAKVGMRHAPGRCPYCKDLITVGEQVVACAGCGSRHHEDCYTEHGACSV